MKFQILALLLTFLVMKPQFASAESLGFSLSGDSSSTSFSIEVQDDLTLQPITDALVTVSDTRNRGLLILTNSSGVGFIRDLSGDMKNVTVFKDGYSAISILGIQDNRVTVFLKPLSNATPEVIASGDVSGWNFALSPRPFGKPIWVGLVFRSLSVFDLLHFSVRSVVSPIKDVIDIWGDRYIPSNVVMPPQDIPIFLGSAHVDKTHYRLPVPSGRSSRMVAVEGQIDSGDLIDIGMSGKVSAGAVNKFQFSRLGLTEEVIPSSDFQMNVNADQVLLPAFAVTVNKPPFESDVLAVSYSDLNGDRRSLAPMDVKAPIEQTKFAKARAQETVQLKVTAQALGKFVGVAAIAVTSDAKRLSGIIPEKTGTGCQTGAFLNAGVLKDATSIPTTVKIQAPAQGLGLTVISSGTEDPSTKRVQTFPIWTVYALPAAGAVTIPTQDIPVRLPVRSYSISQLEFDANFDEKVIDGRTVMMQLKRFTRSAAAINP